MICILIHQLIMRYYDLNMRAGTRQATMDRFSQVSDEAEPDIGEIQIPTLIMWGEDDALTPIGIAKRFEETIPNVQTAYYQDVGHVPMEENPAQSADDINNFMRGLAE